MSVVGSRNWFASGIRVSKLREVQMCVVCWLELNGGKAALNRVGGRGERRRQTLSLKRDFLRAETNISRL